MEIEELESQLGPDETDVDLRRILEEARDEKGRAILETFSTDGPSALLVVRRSRRVKDQRKWDAPRRQNGKRVWKGRELDGARWKEGLWEQWNAP